MKELKTMAVIRTAHVELKVNGNNAYAFVAEPDDNAKHPGVVLIQEYWGIEPHIRDLAQRLATEGFVVAVPDLYHGKIATEPDDAGKMMMTVANNIDHAAKEIIGALNTVKAMPNVEPKKLGLIGFCMGGLLTFIVATRYADLGAVVPFYAYGYEAKPEEVAKVNAPVLAFYGKNDPSVSAENVERVYKSEGKDYRHKVYDAGHAFMNPDHGAGNKQAAADAWRAMVNFLREKLK